MLSANLKKNVCVYNEYQLDFPPDLKEQKIFDVFEYQTISDQCNNAYWCVHLKTI